MEKKEVNVQNHKVVYREAGEGAPVLILHGWGASSESWEEAQEDLANRGYKVVVPDLPGFGESDDPERWWSLADYAEFIHEFTESAGLHQFALGGHSFGGRLAIYYAYAYPKDISALILMAAAGVVRHKSIKLRAYNLFLKAERMVYSTPWLSFLRVPLSKIRYKTTGEATYDQPSQATRTVLMRILGEDLRRHLPQIRKPTLILWGDKDAYLPLADAYIIHRSIPLTHLHIFPDAPHGMHIKIPHKVAKMIDQFLQ